MTRDDVNSRTVEDAADVERWRAGPYPLDQDEYDHDDAPEEDTDDAPCCNCFSCPCGGSGSVGR